MARKHGPTLRAQWLGELLKQSRTTASKTLRDAAAYLTLDPATVSRYESGVIPAKPQDVVALMTLYGVDDPARRQWLEQLSRESWRKGWWDGYHGELSGRFVDYAWLEDRATTIRSFDSLTLPGLVQTPEFAEAVIRADSPDQDERYIERGVEFRMERQRILRKDAPPKITIILDEALLHRLIGGRTVMRAQLRHLSGLADEGRVELHILPFTAGAHGGQQGAFRLFTLPEPFPEIGYAESMTGSTYVESEEAERLARAYDRVLKAALSPSKSVARLARTAKEMV